MAIQSAITAGNRVLNHHDAATIVLGVRISAVDFESATQRILDWVESGGREYVAVTGVHGVMEAQDDPALKKIINDAGMAVPDGVPLVWLSKWAGHSHVSRVFGPDLMLEVCARLAERNGRMFYYGGAPEVVEELSARMEDRFPGLVTAGNYSPPYRALTDREEGEVAERINSAAPDIVWVGLSTPKQENWMARFRSHLNAPVLIGVGAAFDYNTGRIKRAPSWMPKVGLEWLYRVIQDPKRLWKRYARNNPLFVHYLLLEKMGLRDFSTPRR